MTPSDGRHDADADGAREQGAETAWQRRRRLADVFGDVLPDSTADDRDDVTPRPSDAEAPGDAWLRAQVPPHHGGE